MFTEYLNAHWADVRGKLVDLIGRLDGPDLDFRPYDGAWTVRELLLHIAHEEYGEVQHGITRQLEAWPDAFAPAEFAIPSAIVAQLTDVHAQTLALLAGLDDDGLAAQVETPWGSKDSMLALLGHVLEHEVHHRAELSLVLGMLGKPGLDA